MNFFEQLSIIAEEMDTCHRESNATLGYDVLAGGLVWSDEYPATRTGRLKDFDCVKLILRYRTTIILGEEDEALRPYWEKARTLFPNWPGFAADRLVPSDELRNYCERSNNRALRRILTLSDVVNRSKAKKD